MGTATLRLRALRGLSLARALLLPCAVGAVLAAALGAHTAGWMLASVPLTLALCSLAFRVPDERQAAARRLDQHHNLRGLLQSGVAFAGRPRAQLSTFERACMEQALAASKGLDVAAAIPLKRPVQGVLAGSLVGYALLALVPLGLGPVMPTLPGSSPTTAGEPMADDGDLDSPLAEDLARLESQLPQGPDGGVSGLHKEVRALAAAARDGDTAEVLTRLDVLATRAQEAADAPGLSAITRELSAIAEFAQLGEALEAGSPSQVRAAMAALSEQLQQASPAERAKLRRALKTLRDRMAQARQERSLLQRPSTRAEAASEQAEAALERTLESLEARGKDPSEALETLGRSLERLARHARDAQAEREAGRAMQQLAERTRRGDGSPDRPGEGEQQPGQGQAGREEQLGGFLRPTDQSSGEGTDEAEAAGDEGPRLAAPDNAQHAPGHGPGAPLLGDPGGSVDSQGSPSRVRADSNDGPSRSQVIAEVSARGVRSPGYRKVHADYAAHAVQQMEQSPLSQSDRYVVRRYFELIAPKERP